MDSRWRCHRAGASRSHCRNAAGLCRVCCWIAGATTAPFSRCPSIRPMSPLSVTVPTTYRTGPRALRGKGHHAGQFGRGLVRHLRARSAPRPSGAAGRETQRSAHGWSVDPRLPCGGSHRAARGPRLRDGARSRRRTVGACPGTPVCHGGGELARLPVLAAAGIPPATHVFSSRRPGRLAMCPRTPALRMSIGTTQPIPPLQSAVFAWPSGQRRAAWTTPNWRHARMC
jgi:hypothetical protein